MDKQKSNYYELPLRKDELLCEGDSLSEFLGGAILGYCQSHEPEEVAELFTPTFNMLPKDKGIEIAACITGRALLTYCKEEDV